MAGSASHSGISIDMKHLCITHGTMGDGPCPSCKPKRIRLSRRKGFKLPPNTVNVARPSRWGNPFVVGIHGTRERCVQLFRYLCGGYLCLDAKGKDCVDQQQRFLVWAKPNLWRLRGKDLACWCPLDEKPCHADVLMEVANK